MGNGKLIDRAKPTDQLAREIRYYEQRLAVTRSPDRIMRAVRRLRSLQSALEQARSR